MMTTRRLVCGFSTLAAMVMVLSMSSAATTPGIAAGQTPPAPPAPPPAPPSAAVFNAIGTRVDQYVSKPRLIVITDIANEPDDQMSFVRLLVYSNQFDIEALIASTSRHLRSGPRPDVLRSVIDVYETVQPNLLKHQPGFPSAAALRALVVAGQAAYGMD